MPPRCPLILIVEDDELQAEALQFVLRQEGYRAEIVSTGAACLARTRRRPGPDVILLDIGLPDLSGVEVTRRLRTYSEVGVVMVTARERDVDKVVGLDAGADDYVTKPFETNELLARLRAYLRRRHITATVSSGAEDGVLTCGDLRLDLGMRRVTRGGEPIALPARAFDILRMLAEVDGRVVEREHLFTAIWGAGFFGDARALDVYIRLLRRGIEPEPGAPRYLHTVRGVGYRLAYEAGPDAAPSGVGPVRLTARGR